jgi:hypothetical protein
VKVGAVIEVGDEGIIAGTERFDRDGDSIEVARCLRYSRQLFSRRPSAPT